MKRPVFFSDIECMNECLYLSNGYNRQDYCRLYRKDLLVDEETEIARRCADCLVDHMGFERTKAVLETKIHGRYCHTDCSFFLFHDHECTKHNKGISSGERDDMKKVDRCYECMIENKE